MQLGADRRDRQCWKCSGALKAATIVHMQTGVVIQQFVCMACGRRWPAGVKVRPTIAGFISKDRQPQHLLQRKTESALAESGGLESRSAGQTAAIRLQGSEPGLAPFLRSLINRARLQALQAVICQYSILFFHSGRNAKRLPF